jgi:ribosomal-protein-alanine N-acetyltransferase
MLGPIHHHRRCTLIETDRLLLRDLEPSDEDALAAIFADEEVMRYIGAGGVLDRDVARRMIEAERANYAERGWGQWATVVRATGAMIGACGLILWPDIEGREELEVAYLLAREAWGKGYGTEAATAIRDHGLAIRPDLVSLIYPGNTASIHVADKIGMVFERDVAFQGHTVGLYRYAVPSA